MMKTVITGATGFIGIHLIEEWLRRNVQIFAIVRPKSKNTNRIPQNKNIHVLELNMDEYSKLPQLIESADCFYHLAWEGARVPYRDDAEMQKRNYAYALDAFEAAKKLGCSFFLGSGSQAEYGSTGGLVDEDCPCNPTTAYGKQKLRASQVLMDKASETAMNSTG